MHSTTINNTTFTHNGGYEGKVKIISGDGSDFEFEIPFQDLKEFVANYVRDRKIAELENTSAEYILKVL